MIASDELGGWLADGDRQRATSGAVNAVALRWATHPLMTDLKRELEAMSPKTAPAVLEAARRFIARSDDISALVDDIIAGAAADPFFQPPFSSLSSEIHGALLLFEDPALSIALGVTSVAALAEKKSGARGPSSIGFTGLLTLFHFVKAGGATLSFWEAPAIDGDFVAAHGGRCRAVGRRRLEDGETIVIDGTRESFVIEHAEADSVYLQAVVRTGAAPLTVEYDSATQDYVGASSTDEESSRIQMMASLLRLAERPDGVAALRPMLATPHFYMRWHIMRELLAIDADAVLPDLRAMAADDPHPDVRAAAAQTLAAFFDAEEPVACRA